MLSYSIIMSFEILNEMLLYEIIERFIVKVGEFGNASTKTIYKTKVFYYVFWSILSQMRHVCCPLFPKHIVPKFVCSMVTFSMPAILDRILHLASQTMHFGVSYIFFKTVTTHPKYVVMVSLQVIILIKKVWCNLNQ